MAATADLSRGPVLLSLSISTFSLALTTCIVRCCVRKRICNDIGIDDYAIGVAVLVALVGTVFTSLEGASSSGAPRGTRALELDFLAQPWLLTATTLAKISICLSLSRLLSPSTSNKPWRLLLGAVAGLLALANLASALAANLQCRPLARLWEDSAAADSAGSCWSPAARLGLGYFQGAFSVFSWLFLALFPVVVRRELELGCRGVRWPFYCLSGLSLIAAVFATVRTYETAQARPGVYTYDTFCAAVLAVLEQNVGILAANVIPLCPLFSRRAREDARSQRLSSRAASAVQSSSSLVSVKASPALVIEDPRRDSFSGDAGAGNGGFPSQDGGWGGGGGHGEWPRGIIKTVSVYVVEEDIADVEREVAASRASGGKGEQEWEMVLRGTRP